MMGAMLPYGAWGIGALAVIDSSTIPVPIDALLIDFVVHDHAKFLLYCFMAALGSAVGSLLPFYIGKAGGELFLMKRINRKRYEQLRDRFERQEFLAIMLGVQRPTVTIIMGTLQDAGLITTRYGRIRVLKRRKLEQAACECYDVIRAHFERLGL